MQQIRGFQRFLSVVALVVAGMLAGCGGEAPEQAVWAQLAALQAAFNQWSEQSGRPLCQLSTMLAFTVNH